MPSNIAGKIRTELLNMGEDKYRDFSASLMPAVNKETVIGIRIPILRRYAKSMENYNEFLKDLPHRYFEENNLHAFLIEREKDFDKCIDLLNVFLPYVDNWATCDSMKPKVLKDHPCKLMEHIKRWISSKDVYAVRYGINLLMSFYLENHFDPQHMEMVVKIKSDQYYINMMRAWYFATALAKQYDFAVTVLQNFTMDEWTHNKTIQKAIESYRIDKDKKEYLKTLKINAK